MNNNTKSEKVFLWAGLLFIAIGIFLLCLSICYMIACDKTEGILDVGRHGARNAKRAHVTYEYDGVLYEDKGLSSYNAFTMKDGRTCTVYIDPETPDDPKVTSFGISAMLILFGAAVIKLGGPKLKRRQGET